MSRTIKWFSLPDQPVTQGFREMREKDVPQVQKLLTTYLSQFKLKPYFTEEEVAHWFLPREKVVSYATFAVFPSIKC